MLNKLFTKLPYDRQHIHSAYPNLQTNKPKQRQRLLMICWFKKSIWLNLAWGSDIQIDGKQCCWKNIQLKLAKNQISLYSTVWVRQGCSLSPNLFNININELARALEQSSAPNLTQLESEVKCQLFADDLVLLSPTMEGLQQHLDLLHRLCQTWALTDLGPDSKSLKKRQQ